MIEAAGYEEFFKLGSETYFRDMEHTTSSAPSPHSSFREGTALEQKGGEHDNPGTSELAAIPELTASDPTGSFAGT